MKRFSSLLFAGVMLALLVIPAFGQGGEGGVIVESNIGDDPSTFNPIITSDTTSSLVSGFMYPDIITGDDETFVATPLSPKGLAESWEYDESGTVLTLNLRQDLTWADGTSITADDWIWAMDAVRSGETTSSRTYVFFELADGTESGGSVFEYEKIDDYTLEIVLGSAVRDEEGTWTGDVIPNCIALDDLNDIPVVPSHIFSEVFGDDYASMDNDPYFIPTTEDGTAVTYGEFTDPFTEFGVQVSLLADQAFPETEMGYVSPNEWILRQVEDTNVEYERFLAGDFTWIGITASKQNEFRTLNDSLPEEEKYQTLEYPSNGYTYAVWNTADPENPVNGRDADGNIQDQGMHPIFADKLVRQAMAYAIDVQTMIGTGPDENGEGATGILEGNGYPIAVHDHPGLSWVEHGLEPYPYDPVQALELLEEAGWIDNDGDGLLECNDCMYAREVDAAYNGTPFTFELLTNSGNAIREGVGETIVSQLSELGITVEYQAIEFGTLVGELLGQQYDAVIIGWSLGLPYDPDGIWVYGSTSDLVGSGFNTSSYYNAELEDLYEVGKTVTGCAIEDRMEAYVEASKILHEDQPYLYLFAGNVMSAAQPGVENFDPLPYNNRWNIDAWTVGD